MLLIAGEDDMALNCKIMSSLQECYPSNRKHLCELHVYPGAGHLIEPPYAPLARKTVRHNRGLGGDYGLYFISL